MTRTHQSRSVIITLSFLVVGCVAPTPPSSSIGEKNNALLPNGDNVYRVDLREAWCRGLEVASAQNVFFQPTLQRLGMEEAEFQEWTARLDDLQNRACVENDVDSAQFFSLLIQAGAPITAAVQRLAADRALSEEDARALFFSQLIFDARRLHEACGGDAQQTADYLEFSSDDAPDLAAPFGELCSSGIDAGGSDSGLYSCIQQAINLATADCGLVGGETPEDIYGDDYENLSQEEQEQVHEDLKAKEAARQEAIDNQAETQLTAEADIEAALMLIRAETGEDASIAQSLAIASAIYKDSGYETLQDKIDDITEAVERLDRYVGNIKDCLSFGSGGSVVTYESGASSPTSIGEMLSKCLCDNTSYGEGGEGVYFGPPNGCGDNLTRRDCFYYPFGPAGGLNPDCVGMLFEDNEPWQFPGMSPEDAVCMVLQCPEGLSAISDGEACRCENLLNPGDYPTEADCSAFLCPSGNGAQQVADLRCQCGSAFGKSFGPERLFEFGVGDALVTPISESVYNPSYYSQ